MERFSYRLNLPSDRYTKYGYKGVMNPYFMTCAGGILQGVINGFGGLDITDKGVVQRKSVLPTKWTKLILKGIGSDMKTYTVQHRDQ